MTWLIDASFARHSGSFSDYVGILTALPHIADEEIRVLASRPLARAIEGRVHPLEIERLDAPPGVGRAVALQARIWAATRRDSVDAIAFGQYAPLRPGAPYVLRMTDAHLVDHAQRRRLLPFYTPLQRVGWQLKLAAFRRSVRGAARILCATNAVRDQLCRAHPSLDPASVHVAHMGLSPVAAADARARWGAGGRRLLTMHLSPRKNVEVVLEALALPGMEGYELSVLGDLDRPTDRYTRFLAERAAALGVADRVRSLGYLESPERVQQCVLEHDVLLCMSRIESWSHTVVEGLALGVPVVASDIACHREVSGGEAWLVPLEDAEAVASAVRRAADGGPEVRARTERGIEVARKYGWGEHARALVRALGAAADRQ